jgi:hypothetical protein
MTGQPGVRSFRGHHHVIEYIISVVFLAIVRSAIGPFSCVNYKRRGCQSQFSSLGENQFRFETALLYPRSNPWDIMSAGLLPSHAFILREGVHQLQRPGRGGIDRGSGCRDTGWRQGSKTVGVAGLESTNWVRVPQTDFGDGQFYLTNWRLHSWPCDLIGHPVVPWPQT